MSVISDATTGTMWDIAQRRSQKAAINVLKNRLPKDQRKCGKTYTADLRQPFIKAKEHVLPLVQ